MLTSFALNVIDRVPYNALGIMRDCFRPSHIGLGLSLNSPFKWVVDLKLNQLKEAGIVSIDWFFFYFIDQEIHFLFR